MKYIKVSWILLPFVIFITMVYQHAQNIPWMDDYEAILGTVLNWKHASSVGEKLLTLFQQHTEHRIVWTRSIVMGYYYLFGDINFKNLILIGDLQLLIAGVVLVYFIKQYGGKYWQQKACLACICLFDLNTYEAADWAMTSLQNYGVLMFFMLSLLCWSKGKVTPALIFQAIMIVSSGNGMIGALSILIFLIMKGNGRYFIHSLATTIVTCLSYFAGYHRNESTQQFDIATGIEYYIKMLGAHFSFDLAAALGIFVIVMLIYVLRKKAIWIKKEAWPLLAVLAFALLTMGTITVFRSCVPGAQFQTSRYLIYPELIIGIIAVFFVTDLTRLAAAIVLLLFTYTHNYEFGKAGFIRTEMRLEGILYWHPNQKYAKETVDEACKEDIYCIEENR